MKPETIFLEYPAVIGNTQHKRLTTIGLTFTDRKLDGYHQLNLETEITPADLASLNATDLTLVRSELSNTILKEVIVQAERIFYLKNQAQVVARPEYPYPFKYKDILWTLDSATKLEIQRIITELAKNGYEVKFGVELEFTTPPDAIDGFTTAEEVRNQIIQTLSLQLENCTEIDLKTALEQKIEQLKIFTAREIMMYDLIELDERTNPFLQQLFGTNRDGNGYYDGKNCLELKTNVLSAEAFAHTHEVLLNVLVEKATYYGLELTGYPVAHINTSLWNSDGNLFSNQHPQFKTKTPQLIETIARTFYEAFPIFIPSYQRNRDKLSPVALTNNRVNLLRYATDRIEIRPFYQYPLQDLSVMFLIMLTSILEGITDQVEPIHHRKSETIFTPAVHHEPGRCKVTSHVINNATISPDGYLQPSPEYIQDHMDTLLYELGIVDTEPESLSPIFRFFSSYRETDHVIAFFSKVRIQLDESNQPTVLWPTTKPGVYEFILPPINLDYLPPEMAARIQNGEIVPESEWYPFIPVGEYVPKPSTCLKIDVNNLSNTISLENILTKLQVVGYETNTNELGDLGLSRSHRLKNSQALQFGLTPEYKDELTKVMDQQLLKSETATTTETQRRYHFIRELLRYVVDQKYTRAKSSRNVRKMYQQANLKESKDYFNISYVIEIRGEYEKDEYESVISTFIEQTLKASSEDAYIVGFRGATLELEFSLGLFKKLKRFAQSSAGKAFLAMPPVEGMESVEL